jgi:hypothetical protein
MYDIRKTDNIMLISAFLALSSYVFDYVIISISQYFGYDINNL